MKLPDFSYENPLWEKGFSIIGIDEVGRGCFAGPVAVGGVVFPRFSPQEQEEIVALGINDSKKLSAKKREYLAEVIREMALWFDICFVDVPTINEIGIGKATFEGMRRIVENIDSRILNIEFRKKNKQEIASSSSVPRNDQSPHSGPLTQGEGKKSIFALVDAFTIPKVSIPQQGIIRGDSLSISIAAASIIAKVERDTLMQELGVAFPSYGFENHKGYGTLFHRNVLQSMGATIHHRTQFISKFV